MLPQGFCGYVWVNILTLLPKNLITNVQKNRKDYICIIFHSIVSFRSCYVYSNIPQYMSVLAYFSLLASLVLPLIFSKSPLFSNFLFYYISLFLSSSLLFKIPFHSLLWSCLSKVLKGLKPNYPYSTVYYYC